MIVVYPQPAHYGWSSVTVMARMLAQSFEARLVTVDGDRGPGQWAQRSRRMPTPRLREDVFIVAPQPGHLSVVLTPQFRRLAPRRVFAWVIDSFNDHEVPDAARALGFFDGIFVGDAEALPTWEKVTRTPVHWLPFGTPAMEIVGDGIPAEKVIDLQRLGRQPLGWEDDHLREAAAAERLAYSGSVPSDPEHGRNQQGLHDALRAARCVLAFSNVAAPADYTHPTYQYVTARWLDSLAAGAVVAGTSPRCAAADRTLWAEGLVDFSPTTPADAMAHIRAALDQWTPEVVRRNQVESLRRNDWRLRFAEIASVTGHETPTLTAQLERLRRVTDDLAT